MSIIRSPRKDRNFTIISNAVCLDQRLSMKALGVLVRLLSRPDNWSTNSDTLAREFGCGRDQMRSVLNELSEAQYMALNKVQDEKGHWASFWVVYDEPTTSPNYYPKPEEPKTGLPEPGNPYFGESGPITRTDLTRTDNKRKRSISNDQPDFELFWTAYPRKTNKGFARTVFAKIKPDDTLLKKMISSIEQQKRSDQWKDPKYIPHPSSWLNGERWEDETTGKPSFNPFAGAI